jgi:octaprenyl-diphosphate synthase
MTASTAPQNTQKNHISALSRLDNRFKNHMLGVNELILSRFQSEVPLIPQIATYLIAAGGKRIRPLLTLAAASFSNDEHSIQKAYGFAAAVEFIHTATLLHDDVVDESDQRRGKKSANLVFGNQSTVLVGDYLFSKAFELMVESGSLQALNKLSTASAIIAEGEVLQLSNIGNTSLTLDVYLKTIESKTAALFRAATESGAIISGQSKESQKALYEYGHNLGLCFQIADDIIDYRSTTATMGKAKGDDFFEGKITLPTLLAIEKANEEEKAFWRRCLTDKKAKDPDLQTALDLFEKYDIFSSCFAVCETYKKSAMQALSTFPESATKHDLISILDEVIDRAS